MRTATVKMRERKSEEVPPNELAEQSGLDCVREWRSLQLDRATEENQERRREREKARMEEIENESGRNKQRRVLRRQWGWDWGLGHLKRERESWDWGRMRWCGRRQWGLGLGQR
uniref:Uncharacterized protein n=1 Tax=Cannabis sativa TaxID=3483 RepID=A0A803PME2_CANSA